MKPFPTTTLVKAYEKHSNGHYAYFRDWIMDGCPLYEFCPEKVRNWVSEVVEDYDKKDIIEVFFGACGARGN